MKVTVDANVLNDSKVSRLKQAAAGLPIEFVTVTVTDRERGQTSARLGDRVVYEPFVLGESPLGQGALVSNAHAGLFETLLVVMSSNNFPKKGDRGNLTPGQQRMKRDAMMLLAHVRDGHDILLTDEKKAFVGKKGAIRRDLEVLCSTRIMNVDEFCGYCEDLRKVGQSSKCSSYLSAP